MAKPLRSEIKDPQSRQFEHFGVLNTGDANKGAFFGSMIFNAILLLIVIIIGASAKKIVEQKKAQEITFAKMEKPPEPIKPKIPPPPPPKLAMEPPKILRPEIKPPDPVKPMPPVVKPVPVPTVTPMAPKVMTAAAAPKVVAVSMAAKSASVVNNDPHPSEVRLGSNNSPVPNQLKGPAVAAVNLNRGMSGMPASNTGSGPAATAVSLGNGSPGGHLGGGSPVAVQGVKMGCAGCTGDRNGNGTGTQVAAVKLPGQPVPTAMPTTVAARGPVRTGPQVLYKPRPVYTSEATAAHIEGSIAVKIKVSASGAVTVLGLAGSGLGHGLDESAIRCAQGIRFKPAVDASGNPTDWEGTVTISFQLA